MRVGGDPSVTQTPMKRREYGLVAYCTIFHCTVLYCTVLYCTVLYCTVLQYTIVCSSISLIEDEAAWRGGVHSEC